MNLKTAACIAALLVVISIFLSLFGQALTYVPTLRYFHWGNVLSMGVGVSTMLLSSGGLLVFLLAYTKHGARPSANMKSMYVLAGCLVACSALISVLHTLPTIINLHEHITWFRYSLYLTSTLANLAWEVCLCVFIFLQLDKGPTVKVMAVIALATTVVLCGVVLLNVLISKPWAFPSILNIVGTVLSTLGFYAGKLGAGLFLLMYLIAPAELAGAAADPVSEPAL